MQTPLFPPHLQDDAVSGEAFIILTCWSRWNTCAPLITDTSTPVQPHRCQNSRCTSGTSSELASWQKNSSKSHQMMLAFFGKCVFHRKFIIPLFFLGIIPLFFWDNPHNPIVLFDNVHRKSRPSFSSFPSAEPWIGLFQEGFPCILKPERLEALPWPGDPLMMHINHITYKAKY